MKGSAAAGYRMTKPLSEVLTLIHMEGPIGPSEIAARRGRGDKSYASLMCRRLQRAGLVARTDGGRYYATRPRESILECNAVKKNMTAAITCAGVVGYSLRTADAEIEVRGGNAVLNVKERIDRHRLGQLIQEVAALEESIRSLAGALCIEDEASALSEWPLDDKA